MTKKQKIILTLLILATIVFIKFAYFPSENPQLPNEEQTELEDKKAQEEEIKLPKEHVIVFFIGQNSAGEEIYRAVKKEYNKDAQKSKLRESIEILLKGPSAKEKSNGVYSEIPSGTRLISLEETPEKAIINLSADFENGGGTDGLYKRLYQLIKTANKNASTSVYLYINGKQVDVVGGEGIMINQPLNERSLAE